MKKGIYAVLAILTVFALVLGVASCGGGGNEGPKKITITLDLNGGTYDGSQDNIIIKINENSSLGDKLNDVTNGVTKADHDFDKWTNESGGEVAPDTPLKKNTTLTAQWTPKTAAGTYKVTFNSNGGSDVPAQTNLKTGDKVTKPADPTRLSSQGDLWTFDGWFKEATFATLWNFDTDVVGTADIILYAKWTPPAGLVTYKVAFESNGGSAVPEQEIESGQKASAPTPSPTKAGSSFAGWFKDSALTDEWNFTTDTVTADITLYAKWDIANVTVTFKWNYYGEPTTAYATKTIQAGSILDTDFPAAPTALGFTFAGWFTTAAGTGTEFKADTVVDETLTVYAKWTAVTPDYTVPNYPAVANDDIVEEIGLSNGWSAIFQFVLPEGKVWEDYKELTVEHKLADATTPVRARVWGNFTPGEINAARFSTYNGKNFAVVGSWPGGSSGRWIWDNTYPGVTAANTLFATATPTPANDVWFTVKYTIDGTKAHAQWNGHDNAANALPGREPAPSDTGPFYIGVGFSNASNTDPAVVSQIKNVTLVGYDSTIPDIVGMPLYFKSAGGELYRAYNGQLDDDGNLQGGKPYWNIISGADKITAAAITDLAPEPPELVTITFDPNYESKPVTTKIIIKGNTLESTDLAALTRTNYVFLGWFDDATAGDKVLADATYDADTTLYAHWEEFVVPVKLTIDDPTELDELVTPAWGAKKDDTDGIIMAGNAWNNTDHANDNDSLLNIAFPDDLNPAFNNMTITYEYTQIEAPASVPADWTVDAAGIAKQYNSATSSGNVNGSSYFSFNQSGGTLSFDLTKLTDAGQSIQINKGDDSSNKQKRDGLVYGIKITKIEFSYKITRVFTADELASLVTPGKGAKPKDADGFVIMASGTWNDANGGASGEDSLINIAFPADLNPLFDKVTITYSFKDVETITLTPEEEAAGWVISAGLTAKIYNTWDTVSGATGNRWPGVAAPGGTLGPYVLGAGGTLTDAGISFQINGGDDTTNKQKRDGYVFGIKVTKVEISFEGP